MMELLQSLIESLREELKQYGEMLSLLEQEQERVVLRLAPDLLQTVSAIHAQGENIQAARRCRQKAQRQLARQLQQPPDTCLADLIPLAPPDYRPLLSALVAENNQLLWRIQQRARQNHLLLNRSLELMQRFINSLWPGASPVYNGAGNLVATPPTARSLYEAVG